MSITASLLRLLMSLCGFKFWLGLAFKHPPQRLFSYWPKLLSSRWPVTWHQVEGGKIATLDPEGHCTGHVVYLHGGGYALGFLPMFIRFTRRLVSEHHLRVSLLDYPLAPGAGVDEVQAFVSAAYTTLQQRYLDDRFSLCGDSAGGALALVLLQQLRDSGGNMPAKSVLISPWVDADMHRDFEPWCRQDVVLQQTALVTAIDQYRRDLPVEHPRISPIYGGLHDLGEVAVVAGGGELFYPDLCRLKRELNSSEGTSLLWFEGAGLWHDWIYFALPEARVTRQDIGRWLAS